MLALCALTVSESLELKYDYPCKYLKLGSVVDKELYKPRILDTTIDTYLQTFRAVCIEGLSGAGKRGHPHITATVKYTLLIPLATFKIGNLRR